MSTLFMSICLECVFYNPYPETMFLLDVLRCSSRMYPVFKSILLVIVNFFGLSRPYWFLLFCCCFSLCLLPFLAFLGLFIPCILEYSLGWSLPSSTFFRAGLVDRYNLNLVVSWMLFFLHLCWLKVLLGIIVWAGDYGLLQSSAHLSRTFWHLESPLRSQACLYMLFYLFCL